jgi:hypothetical protein
MLKQYDGSRPVVVDNKVLTSQVWFDCLVALIHGLIDLFCVYLLPLYCTDYLIHFGSY